MKRANIVVSPVAYTTSIEADTGRYKGFERLADEWRYMIPRLAYTSKASRKKASRALAAVRSQKPTQVVIWYTTDDGQVGVEISEGTERTKAVGALTIAAQEVWST